MDTTVNLSRLVGGDGDTCLHILSPYTALSVTRSRNPRGPTSNVLKLKRSC